MRDATKAIEQRIATNIKEWLKSRHKGGRVSRNTVATAIVVLDHLLERCPVSREDVISRGGGIRGARSGLSGVLARHSVSPDYLKEVTTCQSTTDGLQFFELLDWGKGLIRIREPRRSRFLREQIGIFVGLALEWLNAKSLSPRLDRAASPSHWIAAILEAAKGRSSGVVEQHLVGAKLKCRLPTVDIPNQPAHAPDIQTAREGDFALFECVYHVTAAPSRGVIDKCNSNLKTGKHPILLVPKIMEYGARALAQEEGIDSRITLLSIEDFLSVNIIEIAASEAKDFFSVLREIVAVYNDRLGKAETDLSLRIEIR